VSAHPLGTPRATAAHVGILASAGWLAARGLFIPPDRPWRVTILLSCNEHFDTQLTVNIENAEWMIGFAHAGKRSNVIIKEPAPVAEPDDFQLAGTLPPLKELGTLLRDLEVRYQLTWKRTSPVIETTIAGADPVIRAWIALL
jgi:hypothetical protein